MAIDHQGCAALRKVTGRAISLLLVSLLVPEDSQATNGLNLIGSGGISSALAGADTAVATDFTAMNTNPAGMTQISGTHTGLSVTMLQPELRIKNSVNDKNGENQPLVLPNMGIVRHLSGTPITLGIGFFTVGGNSADFRGITTGPLVGGPTVDKQGSQLRHFKLAPTIAYQVTDKLSLGVALAVSYMDASLTFIPNTPSSSGNAFGFETTGKCNRANGLAFPPTSCGYSFGFTPKFGAMYKASDMVTLGVAYTMPAPITFDHGQISKNFGGVKSTFDYQAYGLKLAQDVAVGIAVRPTKDLLIAAKFQFIDWEKAMNNAVVKLTNGNNPLAPTTDTFVLNYQWRQQYVGAVGAAYDVTERLTVRGGYNYGNNPVPKTTVDVTNGNIVEHHIVAGLSYRFTQAVTFDIFSTYAVLHKQPVNNAIFPNATLEVGGYDIGFTLSYRN